MLPQNLGITLQPVSRVVLWHRWKHCVAAWGDRKEPDWPLRCRGADVIPSLSLQVRA